MSDLKQKVRDAMSPARAEVSRRLKRQRDRFVAFAFAGADVLLEIRADTIVSFCAGAAHSLFGISNDQIVGRPLDDLVTRRDYSLLQEALVRLSRTRRFNHLKIAFTTSTDDVVLTDVSGISLPGPVPLFHLSITRLKTVSPAMMPEASMNEDGTIIPEKTRDHFIAMVEDCVTVSRQSGKEYALTLIALSGGMFQALPPGDVATLLRDVETNLRAWSVGGESVGRLNERKFGIVHEKNVSQQVIKERLGEFLSPFDTEEITGIKSSTVTMSMENMRPEDVNKALIYIINKFVVEKGDSFSIDSLAEGYQEAMSDTLSKVDFFRSMINSPHFIFVFQPIVDLKNWDIHHYEALSRIHKDNHYLLPAPLIRFAEDIGVVSEMDMVVCQKAIATLKDDGPLPGKARLAINLSGRSLDNPRFIQELISLLSRNQHLLRRLLFEVTESSVIRNLHQADAVLQKLRRFGSMVCLDDFGAGSSAFHYLRALSIDFVKIDGSYIRDGYHSRYGKPFVRAIAGLCRELGIRTIGEMVEDELSVRLLQETQVDFGQGYFFSRPQPNVLTLKLPARLSFPPSSSPLGKPSTDTGRKNDVLS